MRIKTTDPGGFLDDLDADAASMIAALGCAFLLTRSRSAPPQGCEQSQPGAFEAQAPEMGANRLPRREVAREVAPGAARAQDVEDRAEDGAQRVGWGPAPFGQGGEMPL